MQSVSSRIWTRVAVSIFYDDTHYTMSTSLRKDNTNINNYITRKKGEYVLIEQFVLSKSNIVLACVSAHV